MTDDRKKNVRASLISAWGKADREYEDLRIQADPILLSIYREEKRDIPNLNFLLKSALIRTQSLFDEMCSLIGDEKIKYPEPNLKSTNAQGDGRVALKRPASISRPSPVPEGSLEYIEHLRERVKKGKEYLWKNYWGVHDQDRDKDQRLVGLVKKWFDLSDELFERDKKNGRFS